MKSIDDLESGLLKDDEKVAGCLKSEFRDLRLKIKQIVLIIIALLILFI